MMTRIFQFSLFFNSKQAQSKKNNNKKYQQRAKNINTAINLSFSLSLECVHAKTGPIDFTYDKHLKCQIQYGFSVRCEQKKPWTHFTLNINLMIKSIKNAFV